MEDKQTTTTFPIFTGEVSLRFLNTLRANIESSTLI
jgi:hypothetical protein